MNKATVKLSLRKLLIATLAMGPLAILPAPLWALPTTAQYAVTNGSAALTLTGVNGAGTASFQVSDKTVIYWGTNNTSAAAITAGTFNVQSGETWAFTGLSSSGAVLNKVGYISNGSGGLLTDPAVISGTLQSSGKVFVVANGAITVNSGASVNTAGGLVLSTLFAPSDFTFTTTGVPDLTGTSNGTITLGSTATPVGVIGNFAAYAGTISDQALTTTGDLLLQSTTNGQGINLSTQAITTVGGNLTVVTNNGAVTQTNAVSVGNITSLTTGAVNSGVNLSNAANSFKTVSLNVGNGTTGSTIVGTGNVVLGASTLGQDLTVTTNGNITTSGAVVTSNGGNVILTSNTAGNITFANASSVAGRLDASTASGPITINTAGNLTTGTITATSGNAISITTGNVATVNGTVSTAGNISLSATSVATGSSANASLGVATIGSASVTSPGAGYTAVPTVTFSAPTTGTTATGTLPNGLLVNSATLTNAGGAGYTAAPTVAFSASGGSGAAATAVVNTTTGVVTAINITNAGTGYTAVPTITVTGGGATTTATATAVDGLTSVINVTGAGSGYVTTPAITFSSAGQTTTGVAASALNPSSNTVSITTTGGAISLPTVNALALNITSGGGSVTQSGTTLLNIGGAVAGNGTVSINTGTGNATLTNNNPLVNATLSIAGNSASITGTKNLTLGSSNLTGNLTVNTTASTYGNGTVTLGSGFGTAATPITIGGALAISTNNSKISDDAAANENVFGAVTLNTTGSAGTGVVISIPVTSGGSGYTATPTVALSGGGAATQATATAVVVGGVVTSILVNTAGSGYTSIPTVALSAVTGSTAATAGTPNLGAGGDISLTAASAGVTGTAKYGSFNATGNSVVINEASTVNLGNISATSLTANSTNADVLINGVLTTYTTGGASTIRASSGNITEGSGGLVNIAGTITFNSSNSFGTNLSNSSNSFGGAVQLTNGGNDIIVSGSNFTLASGTSVTSGNVNITTVGASNNSIAIAGGNMSNATFTSGGNIVLGGGTFRNVTLTANDTTATSITQNASITTNGTLTLASQGNTVLNVVGNNLTGPVVLNNSVADTTVYSARNLTISGTSGGNLTAVAGAAVAGTSSNTFSNPWNLVLGNLNVKGLNVSAMNGNTTVAPVSSYTITGGGTGYTAVPTVTISGGTGVGALTATSALGLGGTTLTNAGGAGYTAAPTITFSASGGSGATATAAVNTTTGVVTGITITNPGTGYTAVPTITISGGGATTTATATSSLSIVSLTPGTQGSGYIAAPTVTFSTSGSSATATAAALLSVNGNLGGGNATAGTSGTITQASGATLHVENAADFVTYGGTIVIGNNGNSAGRVQLSTGGSTGLGSTGNVTYVEDSGVKLGNIATVGTANITSRTSIILDDPTANDVIGTSSTLNLSAPNGSILIAGQSGGVSTHTTGTTTGNIVAANITAGAAASIFSNDTITLGATAANSLTVISSNNITQSAPLNIFGLASFTATNNITLTTAGNNFGPISLATTTTGKDIAIVEANTLNLRTVTMPGGTSGNFSATSANADIISTGFGGIKAGGTVLAPGSGSVSLIASNGNITIGDATTDFPTSGGLVFNAKNVSISVLGNSNLVLGNSTTASVAAGNLTVTSAIGNITNGGNIVATGTASFQSGNGNITLNASGDQFGSVKFVGNQVNISQSGDMVVLTGSSALGNAQLASGGNISITNAGGLVSFGGTIGMVAVGNITLPKLLQASGTLTVNAAGTKNLGALSVANDLNGKTPVNLGTGAYTAPHP